MRTLLVALMVGSLGAAPAHAAQLRLKRLAVSDVPPVASAGSGGLAYLVSSTALRVRRGSGPARTYVVGSGCIPTAMAAGVVALGCDSEGVGSDVVAVLHERDGSIVAVPQLEGRSYGGASAIGKHWLRTYGSQIGDDPRDYHDFLVEWRTGRVIELATSFGRGAPLRAEEYADLDARNPIRMLCAPVFKTGSSDVVARVGQWVLHEVDPGWALQRCGASKLLQSEAWGSPVLGRDALAYLLRRRIVVRDLRSGNRLVAAWPRKGRVPRLAMYGRRLVVFDSDSATGAGPYRIYLGPSDF